MEKEDRKLLEQQGFLEDRSFYHSWSKESKRFQVFSEQKRVGYVSLSIMEDEDNMVKCQADLMIEVEGSENFDDYSSVHLFTFYKPTVKDVINSIKLYMKGICFEFAASVDELIV